MASGGSGLRPDPQRKEQKCGVLQRSGRQRAMSRQFRPTRHTGQAGRTPASAPGHDLPDPYFLFADDFSSFFSPLSLLVFSPGSLVSLSSHGSILLIPLSSVGYLYLHSLLWYYLPAF